MEARDRNLFLELEEKMKTFPLVSWIYVTPGDLVAVLWEDVTAEAGLSAKEALKLEAVQWWELGFVLNRNSGGLRLLQASASDNTHNVCFIPIGVVTEVRNLCGSQCK